MSRLHAANPGIASRRVFVERLTEVGITVDVTRISRWESGRVAVPDTVVAAYETLLGLEAGTLVITATELTRVHQGTEPQRTTSHKDPVDVHQQLDSYFQLVLVGEATGAQWLELCRLLTRVPHVFLLQNTWDQVADLLAQQLARSVGTGFLSRFAALQILVAHPSSRRHAVRAIGTVVTNSATEFVVHPLAVLREVQDPQATELLVRLLQGPPGHLRTGASWAVAGSLTRHETDEDTLARYENVVVDILNRSTTSLHQMDALNIYSCLPQASRERLAQGVSDPATRRALDLAGRRGELRPAAEARAVATHIADTAQEQLGTTRGKENDQMLHRLVREALFHVQHERRHHAALLIRASPYRNMVADLLLDLGRDTDLSRATIALHTLYLLAAPEHRAGLWTLANEAIRPEVQVAGLMAFGQVVGVLSDDEVRVLTSLLADGPGQVADAVLHVLGMAGGHSLDRVADPDERMREAITWWRSNVDVLA